MSISLSNPDLSQPGNHGITETPIAPSFQKAPLRNYQGEYHQHPFPLRVRPHRWESLPSFPTRSATRMQYESITHIIQPESSDYRIPLPAIPLLAEQSDYRFLSDLLLLSEKQLYQMTLHRFVAPFQHATFFPGTDRPRLKPPQYLRSGFLSYHMPIQKPLLEEWAQRNFFFPRQRPKFVRCACKREWHMTDSIGIPDTC